jgi:hypothetical protein
MRPLRADAFRRLAQLGASLVLALVAQATWPRVARAASPTPTFALSITVVEESGKPVRPEAWVDDQIANARRLYDPLGVQLRWTIAAPLDVRFANLVTRNDRDDVGEASFVDGTINVAVVASLGDVDEPGRLRMGVCWQSRVDAKKRFIVLASTARPTVLAHELGHFFGNGHSTVVDNVMSYTRSDADVFFDAAQIAIVKRTASSYLTRGVLTPAPPARLWP